MIEQSFEQIERIKEGWIEFLGGQGYDVFGTITFKEPSRTSHVAVHRAVRVMRKFCKAIGLKHLHAFIVAEQHASGTWHCHVLWRSGCTGPDGLSRMLHGVWQFTFDRLGRCSFEAFHDGDAVRSYVCKYLLKHPGDWAILGDARRVEGNEFCKAGVKELA